MARSGQEQALVPAQTLDSSGIGPGQEQPPRCPDAGTAIRGTAAAREIATGKSSPVFRLREIGQVFAIGLRKGTLPRMGGLLAPTDSFMVNRPW